MKPLTRSAPAIRLALKKDLTRSIKQGHAWLYSDAVNSPPAPTGSVALLSDRKGDTIAAGIYCSKHPITLRVCTTNPPFQVNDGWFIQRICSAIELRKSIFEPQPTCHQAASSRVNSIRTTGYRLVNGEGDGLPGLIIDRYDRTAVIKLDGGAPEEFYQPQQIACWLVDQLGLETVVYRARGRGTVGTTLIGDQPQGPVPFLENGMRFTADILSGQKTGFFLDQRDNRELVRNLAANRRVLNLFSFSGGFSVAAGMGGANAVTSVDIAPQAIAACQEHWRINELDDYIHTAEIADCFDWLEQAVRKEERWDMIICDPPSFSPSQQTRQSALSAYSKLAQWTCQLVEPGGLLALASCSSHVTAMEFTQANLNGFGRARRLAKLLNQRCLPPDHPTPLAMPELRYLKFQLFQLNEL